MKTARDTISRDKIVPAIVRSNHGIKLARPSGGSPLRSRIALIFSLDVSLSNFGWKASAWWISGQNFYGNHAMQMPGRPGDGVDHRGSSTRSASITRRRHTPLKNDRRLSSQKLAKGQPQNCFHSINYTDELCTCAVSHLASLAHRTGALPKHGSDRAAPASLSR